MKYNPKRDGVKKDDFESYLQKKVAVRDYGKYESSGIDVLVSSTVPNKRERPIVLKESRFKR